MRKNLSSTWRGALGGGLAPDATSRRTKALPMSRGFFATSARDPRTMAPYDASLSWRGSAVGLNEVRPDLRVPIAQNRRVLNRWLPPEPREN